MMNPVFIGMGGNSPHSAVLIRQAFDAIAALPGVDNTRLSRLYRTSPVSPVPQPDYVNAACYVTCSLAPEELLAALQRIEVSLGKVEKPKDAPRPIDLDILLFGLEECDTPALTIPHPRWRERKFVLVPLLDLTEEVGLPNEVVVSIRECLAEVESLSDEKVSVF